MDSRRKLCVQGPPTKRWCQRESQPVPSPVAEREKAGPSAFGHPTSWCSHRVQGLRRAPRPQAAHPAGRAGRGDPAKEREMALSLGGKHLTWDVVRKKEASAPHRPRASLSVYRACRSLRLIRFLSRKSRGGSRGGVGPPLPPLLLPPAHGANAMPTGSGGEVRSCTGGVKQVPPRREGGTA